MFEHALIDHKCHPSCPLPTPQPLAALPLVLLLLCVLRLVLVRVLDLLPAVLADPLLPALRGVVLAEQTSVCLHRVTARRTGVTDERPHAVCAVVRQLVGPRWHLRARKARPPVRDCITAPVPSSAPTLAFAALEDCQHPCRQQAAYCGRGARTG